MCLACEQDAMWFAYLRRRGLITADGQFVEEPPSLFVAEPAEPSVPAEGAAEQAQAGDPRLLKGADEKKLSDDDPTAQ